MQAKDFLLLNKEQEVQFLLLPLMNQLLHVSLSLLSDDQQSYFVLDSEASSSPVSSSISGICPVFLFSRPVFLHRLFSMHS